MRSTHTHTLGRYGHKWVVLAVLVQLPFANRPWALPMLVGLDRDADTNHNRNRPHRTPAQLMIRLLRVARWWMRARQIVFVGDGGFSSHELAKACGGLRITLVGLLGSDAALYEPAGVYSGKGRPRVRGKKLPSPAIVVNSTTSKLAR